MRNTYLVRELEKAIDTIADLEIKQFTYAMLTVARKGFWEKAASRKHHPVDERGESGNLLHTIRVVRLVIIVADCCSMGQADKDILISAAALHDMCRYGLDGVARSSVPEHPELVRQLANKYHISCRCDGTIFRIIESHMGRWGVIPYLPSVDLDSILHIADTVSARSGEVWMHNEGRT